MEEILKMFDYNNINSKYAWDNMMQTFAKCIENFYNNQDFDPREVIESIHTLYYDKFLVGEELEAFDPSTREWAVYRVEAVLDEMLYIVPKALDKGTSCWAELESDNLARLGTHTVQTFDPANTQNGMEL
eukprot:TRINITY_DN17012_c0_g1_i2.p2 TRINITY_DN17012_c0_g1~~TRINITY_DN17012_c0_g1_i2.p2  ORF type:complete len:130 (+),score=46.98 TRINITY_DN17012_c0_g1_i2:141-530(+)